MQTDTDRKIILDFLSQLQSDVVRASHLISSSSVTTKTGIKGDSTILMINRMLSSLIDLRNTNRLLRLLVENKLYRLTVWDNPTNDIGRGTDHLCTLERETLDVRSITFCVLM